MTTLEDPVGSFRRRHHVPGSGPRILLGLDGDLLIETESGRRGLARGQALLIPSADGAMRASGHGRFVQASVP